MDPSRRRSLASSARCLACTTRCHAATSALAATFPTRHKTTAPRGRCGSGSFLSLLQNLSRGTDSVYYVFNTVARRPERKPGTTTTPPRGGASSPTSHLFALQHTQQPSTDWPRFLHHDCIIFIFFGFFWTTCPFLPDGRLTNTAQAAKDTTDDGPGESSFWSIARYLQQEGGLVLAPRELGKLLYFYHHNLVDYERHGP